MIKKIGSNKYGVVEYAISSVEDIADLPLGVAIGSTAVLINKDGIRTFALGEGEWVEYIDAERYDKNKLAQDLLFCGFGNDGEKHDDLDDRLIVEFDEINERVNVGNYLEYNGRCVKADYSLEGLQKGVMLEGRTLQNLAYDYTYYIGTNGNFTTNSTMESGKNFLKVTLNQPTEGSLTHNWNFISLGEARKILFKDQTTYTFILKIDTNIKTLSVALQDTNANNTISSVGVFVNGRTTIRTDFSKSEGGLSSQIVYVHMSLMKAGDYVNISDLIILEGDHTETPLEELPFIEGIQSVGDKSKNLITKDFEGMLVGVANVATDYIKIKPNTSYVVSMEQEFVEAGTTHITAQHYYIIYNKDGVEIQRGAAAPLLFSGTVGEVLNNKTVITTPSNADKIKIWINPYHGSGSCTVKHHYLQFEEGTQATPYQPYYDGYKISGKSCGRNLFDVNNPNNLYYDTYIGEGNGNITSASDCLTAMCKVKPNTTYCLSGGYDRNRVRFNDKNQKFISTISYPNGGVDFISVTTPANCEYLYWYFGSEQTADKTFYNIQIEESPTPTPYEPYQESTYSYILDEPLRSLPDGTCDTYDFESGILTQRVGKAVLDGSYEYYVNNTLTNTIIIQMSSKHKIDFKCKPSSRVFCDTIPYMTGLADVEHFRPDGSAPYAGFTFWINKTRLSSPDINGFKEWIRANPMTVCYKLVEPIIHQLDPSRIYSFKDTTHITSDNLIAPRITTNILTNSNALISHLKGENLALTNEVSTLSLRNRETQETNETQDHIIDASLCAVDELYMMYETTQEVEAMSADEEGSRMVDMYVAMVQRGLKTIDQVPVRYRERVREILAQLED